MGLFQKQPIREEIVLPYALQAQANRIVLIVGLGNPGTKYDNTRHNIGFSVIDSLVHTLSMPELKLAAQFDAYLSQQTIATTKVIVIKPTTYMNESGVSVQKVAHYYKILPENIIVIHDELSIPFGTIRMRMGGQSAGHNGIKSVIQHCGSDFGRIRIGIKNSHTPKDDTSGFVLGQFNSDEKPHLTTIVTEAGLVVSEFIYGTSLPHDTRTILL